MGVDLEALSEATAGAVGGVLSTSLLYPLDTCKTKFQADTEADGTIKYRNLLDVLREAIACGKVSSLYQGLATKNGHAVLSGFVYFYSYSYIKSTYLQHAGVKKMGTLANLVVAAAAGVCTATITQPLDTLAARMQTSKPGEAKSLVELLKKDGIWRAFDGIGISLILVLNPAIQYTVFEQLKNRVLERQQAKQALTLGKLAPVALSAFAAFSVGAISKCIATVLTYPLIRCKVMMQRALTPEEEEQRRRAGGDRRVAGPPANMLKALHLIWHSEGIAGLYKGMSAQILKTVIAAALMLMIKEQVAEGSKGAVLALHRLLSRPKKVPAAPGGGLNSGHSAAQGGSSALVSSASALRSSEPAVRVIPVAHHKGYTSGSPTHHVHVMAMDEGAV